MSGPLSLAIDATAQTRMFGAEQQPVLCVDNALTDPLAVVEIAARHEFAAIGPFYPGVRAAVSERVAMPLVQPILPLLQTTFGLARVPRFLECFLSLLTVRGEELQPIQRFPHFDGTSPSRLAVLLYLDTQQDIGTAFYRQRASGFESVDAARLERYRAQLEADVAQHGLPDAGFIREDSALFERIHRVAGRFNRMVVYRGNALHCADISKAFEPRIDPREGRLTLNLFLD